MDSGYVIGYQIESSTRTVSLIFLALAFITFLSSAIYIAKYYRPNLLEIALGYGFYILAGLFAIQSDNWLSLYLSLELQSLSAIACLFAIGFLLPDLIESAFKLFSLALIFSSWLLIGCAVLYFYSSQPAVIHSLIAIDILSANPFPSSYFIFLSLSLIGKFGLFPYSLGVLAAIDIISLFSCSMILTLNKFI